MLLNVPPDVRPGRACLLQSRVLDTGAYPVAGLYAAGESIGGLMAHDYVGSGTAVALAIVFGYVAGECVAGQLSSP